MEIKSMIQQGRRRLFVCRMVKKAVLSAVVSIVVCAVIISFIRFGVDVPGWCWGIAVIPWVVLLIWAWPWRFSDIEIARQIDSANSFGDRLSSSLSFMNEEKQTEWMKVQIEDTKRRTSDVAFCESLIKTAYQVERPEHLKWLGYGAALSLVVLLLPDIVKLLEEKMLPSEPGVEIAKGEEYQPNLDVVSQEIRKEQAEQLLEEAENIDDPELKEAARELAQILEDDRAGKLSREEFERRLAALERKLEQSEAVSEPEQKAFDKSVREAVESMPEMHEDPETQELAKALEKNDYDKAADILKDLLNSTDPKDKKKLEKLAKMFGDLARKIDPTDPELKEALKKNRDLVNQLKKELDNEKLSSEDKKAFQDAEKRLKEAEKAQNNLENQKQEQQKQANDKASQALNKLSKALDNTSKDLEKKQDAGEKEDPNAEETKEVKSGEQPQDGKQQQQDGKQQQQDGQQQQQDGKQQQQDGKQQQQDGKQQQQDGQQPDGASGEEGQRAEDALREAAENKKAQKQRDALKDLADKMRKDAQEAGEEKDEKAEERQKNMQDFMDRAKGQEKSEDQAKKQDESGNQAGRQGANGEGEQGEKPEAGIEKAPSEGEEGGERTEDMGNEPGVGHDTSEGEATSMEVKLKDEKLSGMETGDTTGAIIESAGQKGFASESYKEVYQTYEKAAEEILETEEVPQGYKNYVEKYFDMIRPQ